MNFKKTKVAVALFVLVFMSACGGGYYKVTDPSTDKIYYAKDIKKEKGGAIKLVDANTGSTITLQNSEVAEINKLIADITAAWPNRYLSISGSLTRLQSGCDWFLEQCQGLSSLPDKE